VWLCAGVLRRVPIWVDVSTGADGVSAE